MSRWCLALVFAGVAFSQESAQQTGTKKAPQQEEQLPPEEDVTAPKEQHFSFNPVKSKKNVQVGDYYLKKGDYKAAADRYAEATKWNDGNAEAWLRLGEAQEKKQETAAAREAFERYLQLAPDAKNAGEVKKRLEKLKGPAALSKR